MQKIKICFGRKKNILSEKVIQEIIRTKIKQKDGLLKCFIVFWPDQICLLNKFSLHDFNS
jgi:hypothetical protein